MSFGNWDEVITDYSRYYLHTSLAEQAKGILDLIPEMRECDELKEMLPGTSHATLFLEFPSNRTSIRVWYEGEGMYRLFLSHPDKGEFDTITIDFDRVIYTLKLYARRLQKA